MVYGVVFLIIRDSRIDFSDPVLGEKSTLKLHTLRLDTFAFSYLIKWACKHEKAKVSHDNM